MGVVDESDLLLLNSKAILFCGMRMCFALTFCGGISFCCLKRQRKGNGLPTVTGKTSVISHLCAMLSYGPAELCLFPGSSAAAGTLQAPRHTLQSPFVQGTPALLLLNGQEQTRGSGM